MTADLRSRRLRIVHHSGYRYGDTVTASFNEARMTPLTGDGQLLIDHSLSVDPSAAVLRYVDYWGAEVAAFDVQSPHVQLEVVAESLVDTAPGPTLPDGVRWQDLSDEAIVDRWCEFLEPTGYVDDPLLDPQRAAFVDELRRFASPSMAIAHAVDLVRQQLTYTPGVTTVSTTAREAWAAGHGVCQDFTHATLSLLRSVGIPARYVSGYLHTEHDSLGETVLGESHAWIEAWDGGWHAYDPTNDRRVGASHVVVARGRDYNDVPPLKGIYAGGASEALGVRVEITQLPR
jgi:transglutaminase-like putative cysteine protease